MLHEFTSGHRIAYFSMEIALENDIPTYAGGLGVLAGDTLRSAADLDMPLVGVTLVSRAGYFQQKIDSLGRQIELPATWDPAAHAEPLLAKVAVQIERRTVWVGAWLYRVKSICGPQVPVILLDTDLSENSIEDREITHFSTDAMRPIDSNRKLYWGWPGFACYRLWVFRFANII